ncbi:glycosyltransferase family 2 protein [Roseovarius sp. LXJ103]|uniref:glycosyltransferase n=1 Tax=Roseovarius carneus TaxID=2853164 RepID=UPI000D60D9FB|nr:glycosyltransferase family 2 protein [Roseovarius carneus]MBZ8119285.1 glycosyltransferase family 2 protein [Roseovarius carneus]PWE35094.1 glycosyl transferase [Pelagicola sp. LXJ1103]
MSADPSVLTVILNYRTPELAVKACAAALREMAGIRGEIVVVDNQSGDDSCAVIGEAIVDGGWDAQGRVRLIPSGRNGGFGAGNNFGIRQGLSDGSAPDFVYILNSDAWPEKGAIRALLEVMQTERKAGIVGSYIRGVDGHAHQTAFRFPSIAGEFEGAVRTGIVSRLLAGSVVPLPVPQARTTVGWVAGASAMMRRRMLDEIGMFDETFFLYYEETDLCLRATRAGWDVVYEPLSEVLHIGSVSTGMKTWARTPDYWFASRRHYFTKNHGRGYAACATIARVAGAVLWRLRWPFTRRPLGDPPQFLRDLLMSSVAGTRSRASRPSEPRHPTAEEAQ